jgi:hypothetical protein
VITVLVPDAVISRYLGGGFSSMLLVLVVGIPLYICATASTPIAAALILKGVSPGTALVFLLVGPATNITSLSVLVGLLGRRATLLYLVSIAVVGVFCGLLLDQVYQGLGLSPQALVGAAGGSRSGIVMTLAAIALLGLSVRPLYRMARGWFRRAGGDETEEGGAAGCGCGHAHGDFPVSPSPAPPSGKPFPVPESEKETSDDCN